MNSTTESIRAFIAVPLSEPLRLQVSRLQQTLKRRGVFLRWVAPDHLHLTLKFLGDVTPDTANALGAQLEATVQPMAPFRIGYRQLGAFPDLRSPRVFWIGVGQGRRDLIKLAESISALVKQFPTQADNKKFQAHLTIGRSRRGRTERLALPPNLLDMTIGETEVNRVQLIESVLKPAGPVYTVLRDCRFEGK